jgi:nitrogen fixation/metabolism regulation signal transduction histidine kinase
MTNQGRPSGKTRLYIAGAIFALLAVAVFSQQAFNLSFIPHSEPNQFLLLYTLSTLIFVVLLVFGFILLRTLVKVWIERKQGKPGSRFKTSLLAMMGILTLLPAISVFAYAYGLVNRSIDRWFGVPIDTIFATTQEMERVHLQRQQDSAKKSLDQIALNLPSDFDRVRELLDMKALVLLDPNGIVQKASAASGVDASAFAEVGRMLLGSNASAFNAGHDAWTVVRRLEDPNNGIVVGVFSPRTDVEALSTEIAIEKAEYAQRKQENVLFRDTYLRVLALMTVLVLFAAVWVGLFLARRVTTPMEALAAATREISSGNLDYRIEVQAHDELGMLVNQFNAMASRLQSASHELETRRHYMEVILENIPTGVISFDSDFRINTLNRAARQMFTTGNATRLEDIFKGDELSEILSLLEEAGQSRTTREVAFHAPGRPAHSAVTASRLPGAGFVLVVEDLTEFVRAQRASAWRDVARRLAHEIKNPLTPIQLSAERISRNIARLPTAAPRVSTVVQECVGAIVDEVSSLKNLVDEFVRFARLPTVNREPESMRDLVDRTLALYEDRLAPIDLSVEIPADLPQILMDSAQMKRVLINLIDNALEALSGQETRTLRIGCELVRDGTMARLVVEDTGRGIAPEDRERLFTPYFSTRKKGTGLGLSIASRIVSDHGGYIGAEANVPCGTRFIIELPVCPESSLSTTNPASGSL